MMGLSCLLSPQSNSPITGTQSRRRGSGGIVRCLSVPLVAAICLAGCDPAQPPKIGKNTNVIVTTPITDTVMDYQDFSGRLSAIMTVEMRARVSGYVTQAPFKEGDPVKKGETLFQIDERPYQADVNQTEANLNVAIAERNLLQKNAERARKLMLANSISREDYETTLATFEKSGATVKAMEAAKERALLYLDYTKVIAPIDGRISRRFVDPGNLINADNTVLTSIVSENPMYAYFDVDERTYIKDLLPSVAPGQISWYEGLKLPVLMRLSSETEYEKTGVVDFVDNRVVATTGTVRMRGVFENQTGMLKAGLFVRIRLPIGSAFNAILIPDEAILSDQERKYVWVVNAKNEVEYRSVKLGQSIKELRVIRPAEKGKEGKEGLTEGERVIISGMQRVRNGIPVDAEMQTPPPLPQMPLVQLLLKRNGEKETRR
jgi:RND family efflux transporter MFP subunit